MWKITGLQSQFYDEEMQLKQLIQAEKPERKSQLWRPKER
jgi:hypothetical protein